MDKFNFFRRRCWAIVTRNKIMVEKENIRKQDMEEDIWSTATDQGPGTHF